MRAEEGWIARSVRPSQPVVSRRLRCSRELKEGKQAASGHRRAREGATRDGGARTESDNSPLRGRGPAVRTGKALRNRGATLSRICSRAEQRMCL